MELTTLTAVSPIDGRYGARTIELREIFSEYGLIRYRVLVELAWFRTLLTSPSLAAVFPTLTEEESRWVNAIGERFSPSDAERVKAFEATTNHDVKAVEYFIKEALQARPPIDAHRELVHFGCTSEDINNLSYALMLRDARADVLLPAIDRIIDQLRARSVKFADQPMLSRTHGQPASPTTVGKEMANFVARLDRQRTQLAGQAILGKMNGAVGNFNAHRVASHDVDWGHLTAEFIAGLGLEANPYTTQIEPHDYVAEFFQTLTRINTILIDFCRDMWGYIALSYFKQRPVEGEVGSSTMPHKVNPIDFENGEGNFGMANAILGHLSEKLPVSRWQRDLTDSTVLRNFGVGIGHSLLGYQSVLRGLSKVELDVPTIEADLGAAWEVLGEAVQTVMRKHGIEEPYEKLKALTRGQKIDHDGLQDFLDGLEIPEDEKDRLRTLAPQTYTGDASKLAREV